MKFVDKHLSNLVKVLEVELKPREQVTANTIRFDSVKWAGLYNYILVNGQLKRISKIDESLNHIEFKDNVNVVDTYMLPEPSFFIGSRMVTSSEFNLYSNDYNDKLPMIWLNFPANVTLDEHDSVESTIREVWRNIRLFFIADSDRTQWTSKETLELRTKVLTEMARYFSNNAPYPYKLLFNNNVKTYKFLPIFGVEDANGAVREIIEGNLSAVFIDFDLIYFKC